MSNHVDVLTIDGTRPSPQYSVPWAGSSRQNRVSAFGRRTSGAGTLTVQLQGGSSNKAADLADDNAWVDIGAALSLSTGRVAQVAATDAMFRYYRFKMTSAGQGVAECRITTIDLA